MGSGVIYIIPFAISTRFDWSDGRMNISRAPSSDAEAWKVMASAAGKA